MSRWATDTALTLSSPLSGAEDSARDLGSNESGSPSPVIGQPERKGASSGLGRKLLLLALSAVCFLSAVFSIFAPAPLLLLYFRDGRKWAGLAMLISGLLVAFLGGELSLSLYASFVLAMTIPLAELLKRRCSLEKSAFVSLISIAVTAVLIGVGYAQFKQVSPWSALSKEMNQGIDHLVKSLQESGHRPWLDSGELEEWKKGIWIEMPSAIAILALVMIWANLVILLRINPNRIREALGLEAGFFRKWKAPDFLVWPTIVSGFFLLIEVKYVSWGAINLFKFLMAIYAIQGLSVLSYFFHAWNIRRFFRSTGFMIATFVMTPLLLSLGFFDLWFDFRSKFRQS